MQLFVQIKFFLVKVDNNKGADNLKNETNTNARKKKNY